ncbi:SMI1/KNR4 family protein [Streptomyces sp. SP17BM10]|uniref:SMI1/KNR4 family protein n=1 Tax=Streptomyces sp. SP17BM10 TaxID=3002530 RepID=UPI002E770AAE|nr:SMI1/KNR4 family protein [Streptomyces sp. SP17BM10]MEE1782788.1 SMI1/KNR4 family protein [Streptomyces sp. SP17BM10]
MTSAIGRLAEVMGDPGREPVEVRWAGAVEKLGVQLPSDFRELVERYGRVQYHGDLVVVAPSLRPDVPDGERFNGLHRFNQDLGEMLEQWYEWYPELGRPYEPFPAPGCLIGWANNTSNDYFCWDTSAADPDQWPVVLWRYGGDEMNRFDGGMADFLAAVLTGDYPDAEELIDRSMGPAMWRSLSP